jgi:hypothetical protein
VYQYSLCTLLSNARKGKEELLLYGSDVFFFNKVSKIILYKLVFCWESTNQSYKTTVKMKKTEYDETCQTDSLPFYVGIYFSETKSESDCDWPIAKKKKVAVIFFFFFFFFDLLAFSFLIQQHV